MKSNTILFSFLFCLVAFGISSCGDSDDTPPVISLTGTQQNTTLAAGEILMIKGSVTDNEELSSIRLFSSGAVTLDETIPNLDSPTAHTLNVNVTIAPGTENGNYAITITAIDAEGNSSNADVNFTVM